jgi:hypothetical protein
VDGIVAALADGGGGEARRQPAVARVQLDG